MTWMTENLHRIIHNICVHVNIDIVNCCFLYVFFLKIPWSHLNSKRKRIICWDWKNKNGVEWFRFPSFQNFKSGPWVKMHNFRCKRERAIQSVSLYERTKTYHLTISRVLALALLALITHSLLTHFSFLYYQKYFCNVLATNIDSAPVSEGQTV